MAKRKWIPREEYDKFVYDSTNAVEEESYREDWINDAYNTREASEYNDNRTYGFIDRENYDEYNGSYDIY